MANFGKYYVGLDIGTDSAGYAVTDEQYRPLKYRGEPMMGTHLIDAAAIGAERRAYRTARRRFDRRQQRVHLIRELFAPAVAACDPEFFKRLDGSALCREDKLTPSKNTFFNDPTYTDREYHRNFPTIHHLICDLMHNPTAHDVRLVYLAVAYLVAHRGHFLSEVDRDDIDGVLDFERLYDAFMAYFEVAPWTCASADFQDILKKKMGITAKEKALIALLFGGKKPKASEDDTVDRALLLKLLAGGKVGADKLFCNDAYSEIPSLSLSMKDEEFDAVLAELGDDSELLILAKRLYDWSILADLVADSPELSRHKVAVYEQHQRDLRYLKGFIRKYLPHKFNEVFRATDVAANYAAYSYHNKSDSKAPEKKATKEDFSAYLLKLVGGVTVSDEDKPAYEDMCARLHKDVLSFCPKQVDGDNRVIPHQLYYMELKKILDNARTYLPFLNQTDADGLSVYDKILSVFVFRIPYFVGPLNPASENAWIERKAGKIYPWNFEKMVDLDASETAFIRRMTNTCTYVPGEKVLPANSLLYAKFVVLNEINNLKINNEPITVACKQAIFSDLFEARARVTRKALEDYLNSAGLMQKGDTLSGIDETIKGSLKAYHFFKPYLDGGFLTEEQAEEIVNMRAYCEDTFRFKKWLRTHFSSLSDDAVRKIGTLTLKGFGRLSKAFLTEVVGADCKTGEAFTVLEGLWNTNNNMMQLLSDTYTFRETLDEMAKEYYNAHPTTLSKRLDDMYISNAVKRPIIRTLDILNDIVKVTGHAPEKIFVEMARGGTEEQKGKRTQSRRDRILEFYKAYGDTDEIRLLKEQLATKDDNQLRGEALYLYFIQLGRCMYSGQPIQIDELGSSRYNVDHIYPQSFVKDDSVLNNKVLVLSEINGEKSNIYPLHADIRHKMYGFWLGLKEKELITEEKFKRLTRSTPFTEDEKWGFINRQLVETRQSTKAIATLLKERYPDTEIVYVKAGLVSEFRQEFDLLKARSINDLHHAKDAYLNIVVGNVYNSCFTKKWFDVNSEYSLKTKTVFGYPRKANGVVVWEGGPSLAFVKSIVHKNNIHLTKYAFCRHGGFFDQMPLKAGQNDTLVARKKGLDPARYGGYNKSSATYFVPVKFTNAKKTDVIFMPVELLYVKKFEQDAAFAEQYAKDTIAAITNAPVLTVEFPLGKRKIKINTVFELDGVRVFVCGKANGGQVLVISPFVSLKLDSTWDAYLKHMESFAEKRKNNTNLRVNPQHITAERNLDLYRVYAEKVKSRPFSVLLDAVKETLMNGSDAFTALSVEDQIAALLNIGLLFKSGRKGGCDLSAIGGKAKAAALSLSSTLSNWKKKYTDVRLVDMSASGLYETRSQNLLELL